MKHLIFISVLFFLFLEGNGQITNFYLQPSYVAVRTPTRTTGQSYYEFWDSNIGWAGIYCGKIISNGSVGIGTTSPGSPLHVYSPSGDIAYFQSGIGSTNFKITQETLNGRVGMKIGTVGASEDLRFTAGSTDAKMVLLHTTGNVGIGTTNPGAPLHVYSPSGDIAYFQSGTGTTNFKITQESSSGRMGMKIGTVGGNEDLRFTAGSTDAKMVLLHTTGNVGIGTTSPEYKLDVVGTIRACEVKVVLLNGCDFVFNNDYKLMDLKKLEEFVKTNQHLPEVASEKEMVENGVNMKDLQMKLLQKMEEMTLYIIEQNKKLEQQNEKIETIEEQNELLKQEIELLKTK